MPSAPQGPVWTTPSIRARQQSQHSAAHFSLCPTLGKENGWRGEETGNAGRIPGDIQWREAESMADMEREDQDFEMAAINSLGDLEEMISHVRREQARIKSKQNFWDWEMHL